MDKWPPYYVQGTKISGKLPSISHCHGEKTQSPVGTPEAPGYLSLVFSSRLTFVTTVPLPG